MIISSVETPGGNDGVIHIEPKEKDPKGKMLLLSHWHERHYGSLQMEDEEERRM